MCRPVRQQQCVELARWRQSSKQMTNSHQSGPSPCQRMRVAGREGTKGPPSFTSRDIGLALCIQNGDPAVAVGHERPLGRLVPVPIRVCPRP